MARERPRAVVLGVVLFVLIGTGAGLYAYALRQWHAVEAAVKLGPPVDRFFDEVLVMAEDSAVRANRLRLLLDVRDTLARLGDFSAIPR